LRGARQERRSKLSAIIMGGYVYIMCSNNKSTLYVGVTSNLRKRVHEHRAQHYPNSFTAKYNCKLLVYYYYYESIGLAIAEEKRIKGGSRQKKIDMIVAMNPKWNDLWIDVAQWD
jgi:putative endonuclease